MCVCVCVIIYLKFHFVAPVFSFFLSPSVRCTAAQEKKENVLHVVIFIICDFARQASSIVKKKAGDSFFFFKVFIFQSRFLLSPHFYPSSTSSSFFSFALPCGMPMLKIPPRAPAIFVRGGGGAAYYWSRQVRTRCQAQAVDAEEAIVKDVLLPRRAYLIVSFIYVNGVLSLSCCFISLRVCVLRPLAYNNTRSLSLASLQVKCVFRTVELVEEEEEDARLFSLSTTLDQEKEIKETTTHTQSVCPREIDLCVCACVRYSRIITQTKSVCVRVPTTTKLNKNTNRNAWNLV